MWVPEWSIGAVCKTAGPKPSRVQTPPHTLMSKEHMTKIVSDMGIKNPEFNRPEIESWTNGLVRFSLFPPQKLELVVKAIQEAHELKTPLPFVLTFCPADQKIESPTPTSPKSKFVPITKDLPRVTQLIEELFGFLIFTRKTLGITPHLLLVFADSLERGIEETTLNTKEMPSIATASIKGVQEILFHFDQAHPDLLQKENIPMPKIHKISTLGQEANKFGISRDRLITQAEFDMLDPLNPLFEIWKKHLVISRHDNPLTSTSWRSKKAAESIQSKTRFLLAQLAADGEILPKLIKELNPKKFPGLCPRPIFITSSTIKAGFEMETDGFNAKEATCVIAPFRNIGDWTNAPVDSPWLNFLNEDIIIK